MAEPDAISAADLLRWAESLAGIARTGLGFTQSLYEKERFEEVLKVAADIRAAALEEAESDALFEEWLASVGEGVAGYVTPKVAVAAVVGNEAGEILLTQRADSGVWLYPVGWADVGYSPSEVAVKEVYEETGIEVEPVSLIAVLRRPAPRLRARAALLARVPLPDARRRAAGPSARDARRSASSPGTSCPSRSPGAPGGSTPRSPPSTARRAPPTSTSPARLPGAAPSGRRLRARGIVNSARSSTSTSARFFAPPASRSMTHTACSTRAPRSRRSPHDVTTCPPDVTTSSTTVSRRPSSSPPSARRHVP